METDFRGIKLITCKVQRPDCQLQQIMTSVSSANMRWDPAPSCRVIVGATGKKRYSLSIEFYRGEKCVGWHEIHNPKDKKVIALVHALDSGDDYRLFDDDTPIDGNRSFDLNGAWIDYHSSAYNHTQTGSGGSGGSQPRVDFEKSLSQELKKAYGLHIFNDV